MLIDMILDKKLTYPLQAEVMWEYNELSTPSSVMYFELKCTEHTQTHTHTHKYTHTYAYLQVS